MRAAIMESLSIDPSSMGLENYLKRLDIDESGTIPKSQCIGLLMGFASSLQTLGK